MINLFRPKGKNTGQTPAKTQVLDLLDLAHAQRAKIHLVFDNEVTSIHNLSCSLLSFDAHTIELELTSLKEAGRRWIGEALTCYFKIVEKRPKTREIFHTFRSAVQDTGQSEHESVLLEIKTPDAIGQDQRRKSLRISPDMANFVTLAAWPYDASGGFDPCSPKLVLADFKNSQARLVNMSAGGMKLVVKNTKLREFDPDFKRGNRVIMYLKITGVPNAAADECWLIAKTSSAYEDFVTKDVNIGLEFIGQGKIDPETQKVVWKKVVDNVIEDIATWTHLWHLELYREKGLGPI
jgi:c-di-GMP-binding flagellar brake protein YcgR